MALFRSINLIGLLSVIKLLSFFVKREDHATHANNDAASTTSPATDSSDIEAALPSQPQEQEKVVAICVLEDINSHSSSSSSSSRRSHSTTSIDASTTQGVVLNPIAQAFKDESLGKTIIGLMMAVLGAFLTSFAPTSLLVRNLVFVSLSFGFAALWNGILLCNNLPRCANVMRKIGYALLIFPYFAVISYLSEPYLQWIPWACYIVVLLPIFYGLLFGHKT